MSLLNNTSYDPENLFDTIISRFNLKQDKALALISGISPTVISKIRNRSLHVSPLTLLKLHDTFGIPVNELRMLMGVEPVRSE